MKNVLALLGSPNRDGNTALLLERFLEGMTEGNSSEIEYVSLNEAEILPCQGCNYCHEHGTGCIIRDDDMLRLCQNVMESHVLVFATPIYWWNMTAQMKLFIDRLYGMNYASGFHGKKVVLLMTYGGEKPNSGPDHVENIFRDICEFTGMNLRAVYGVCTDDYMPVAENVQAQQEVKALGRRVAAE